MEAGTDMLQSLFFSNSFQDQIFLNQSHFPEGQYESLHYTMPGPELQSSLPPPLSLRFFISGTSSLWFLSKSALQGEPDIIVLNVMMTELTINFSFATDICILMEKYFIEKIFSIFFSISLIERDQNFHSGISSHLGEFVGSAQQWIQMGHCFCTPPPIFFSFPLNSYYKDIY